MEPRQQTFDDRLGFELERAQAGNDRRIEKCPGPILDVLNGALLALLPGHGYIPLFGTGTASSRRSTMASGVMRSESA